MNNTLFRRYFRHHLPSFFKGEEGDHKRSSLGRVLFLALTCGIAFVIAGCTGEVGLDGSSSSLANGNQSSTIQTSSSVAVSSAVSVSSSSAPAISFGNVATGKTEWSNKCVVCHNNFDEVIAEAPGTNIEPKIIRALDYKNSPQTTLASYVFNEMPPGNSQASCNQTCADNISAYFFDMASKAQNAVDPIEYDGAQAYRDFGCVACHGNDGLQESQPIIFENYSLETLTKKINDTMPISEINPNAWQQCVGNCASAVAEYLWSIRPRVSCDQGETVLPRRVRGLTKFEYINTINDLFSRTDGDTLAQPIGADTEVRGFDNNAYASAVTSTRLEGYWSAAIAIADVVNVTPWLNTNNCNSQDMGTCFVTKFGLSAFRRPLINDEITDYTAVFADGANNEEGARNVVQAMLISPNFLYRSEMGAGGNLSQYEVATLLAYTFWGSTPDAALLAKAANNTLGNTDQIRQAVDTLLANERAKKQFVHFGRQWLDIDPVIDVDRDAQLFPGFTNQVASAMDQELELFIQEMLLADGYTMNEFFNWDMTFANNALANFYGISAAGDQLTKVAAGSQRGGVLRLGAVLTRNSKFDESHPIKRGLIVRRNLLCQEFGTPPANVGEVEPFDASRPTRERFTAHSENEACATCHQFIDEIGFGFENYDAVGEFRTAEANGALVDATGTITGLNLLTDSDSHFFTDLQDLSEILAVDARQATSSCLAEQFQRMMDGEAKPDNCTVANTVTRWNPAEKSLKDLWVEMVSSQTFTKRQ